MIQKLNKAGEREETALDDVRRIRERLHREAGGDIHKLIEESRRVFEQYREKLGLKLVQKPEQVSPATELKKK